MTIEATPPALFPAAGPPTRFSLPSSSSSHSFPLLSRHHLLFRLVIRLEGKEEEESQRKEGREEKGEEVSFSSLSPSSSLLGPPPFPFSASPSYIYHYLFMALVRFESSDPLSIDGSVQSYTQPHTNSVGVSRKHVDISFPRRSVHRRVSMHVLGKLKGNVPLLPTSWRVKTNII